MTDKSPARVFGAAKGYLCDSHTVKMVPLMWEPACKIADHCSAKIIFFGSCMMVRVSVTSELVHNPQGGGMKVADHGDVILMGSVAIPEDELDAAGVLHLCGPMLTWPAGSPRRTSRTPTRVPRP